MDGSTEINIAKEKLYRALLSRKLPAGTMVGSHGNIYLHEYRCIFDVVMHNNKRLVHSGADTLKNCYNFSIHMKFCDMEDYTL